MIILLHQSGKFDIVAELPPRLRPGAWLVFFGVRL